MTEINRASATRTLKNALAFAGAHAGSLLVLVAITPYIIAKIGLEAYGMWALVTVVARYATVADFGLGSATTKFVAQFDAVGDRRRVREVVTTGVCLYLAIALVTSLTAHWWAPLLFGAVKLPPELRSVAPVLIASYLASFFCLQAAGVFGQALAGAGRLNESSIGSGTAQIAFSIAVFALLHAGFGVWGLMIAAWVQTAVAAVLFPLLALRRLGWLLVWPTRLERDVVRGMFHVGGWIQLTSALVFVQFETAQILTGVFVGVAAVGLYDIASKLARGIRVLSFYFNTALLPTIAARESEGPAAAVVVYLKATRFIATVSIGVAGAVIALAPWVVTLWFGRLPQMQTVVMLVSVLAAAYVVDNIAASAATTLRALGEPKLETLYAFVSAVTNIGLTVALAPKYGLIAILLATAAGTLVGAAVFLTAFASARGLTLGAVFGHGFLRSLAAGAIATAAVAGYGQFLPATFAQSRLGALAAIAILAIGYTFLFVMWLRITGFLSQDDRQLVERAVPRLRPVLERKLFRGLFPERAA